MSEDLIQRKVLEAMGGPHIVVGVRLGGELPERFASIVTTEVSPLDLGLAVGQMQARLQALSMQLHQQLVEASVAFGMHYVAGVQAGQMMGAEPVEGSVSALVRECDPSRKS